MKIVYHPIGEISCGTLRNEDLLARFADTLETAMQRYEWQGMTDKGQAYAEYAELIKEARRCDPESEHASELINESLFDALSDFAPPYSYFGASEGDGASFGFWPITDSESLQDAAESGYRVEVSDHGNVTLYDSLDNEVWGIV